mmetsp:Transcript_12551/g.50230  ORF Transcript_12551/g.50230 Transcript_12551/m.50230 type:complete len:260 (-) Transcript_12551:1260-2039(-)
MSSPSLQGTIQCPFEATLGRCVKPDTCKFSHQPTAAAVADAQYDPARPAITQQGLPPQPAASASTPAYNAYPSAVASSWSDYEEPDAWAPTYEPEKPPASPPPEPCKHPRLLPLEGARKQIKKPAKKKEVVGFLQNIIPGFYTTEEEKRRRALELAIKQDPLNILPVEDRPTVEPETFPHAPLRSRQAVLENMTRIHVQYYPRDLDRACREAVAAEKEVYDEATDESSYRNGCAHKMIVLKRRLRATLASRARGTAAKT